MTMYINGEIVNTECTTVYGVAWDEVDDKYVRTGYLTGTAVGSSPGNALLPIHATMKRCIINDAGALQYYLNETDSTLKIDGSAADLTGAAGQVMVEIPAFYYKYNYSGTTHSWSISKSAQTGYALHPAFIKNGANVTNRYIGAYEGVLYDTSATIYTDGLYLPTHNVGFISATKTIIHRTGTIATVNMVGAAAGTGYAVGNVLTLAGGTVGATVTVATIDGGGGVLSVTLTTKGYGHSTGVVATSGGAGINCTVNIATLVISMSKPYTMLKAGDKIIVTGSVSNNATFTVATTGDLSFTVTEAVADETYAVSTIIQTQKDFTATTGDVLASISGKAPINQATRANFRVTAANRGAGWRQQDYDLISAVQLLYLIEYASFYSQSMIGNGLTDWNAAWPGYNDYNPINNTGLSNAKGNTTFNLSNGNGVVGSYMTYRGIENFYGHLWKWVDGININNNIPYISNTDTQFADDTTTNYTNLGITLINSDGWQNTLISHSRGFLSASVGASSSTKITDYYYQNTGWRVARLGGGAHDGAKAGAFCLDVSDASSYANRDIGARLAF